MDRPMEWEVIPLQRSGQYQKMVWADGMGGEIPFRKSATGCRHGSRGQGRCSNKFQRPGQVQGSGD